MTLHLRGSAVRNGRYSRSLLTLGDVLRFVIYDTAGNIILHKESGTGIDQTDDGNYLITVPAGELNAQTFPKDQYKYAVRITEGDTGNPYLLKHGPLYLKNVPF